VWLLAEMVEVASEFGVERHDWLEVNFPELLSNFEVQAHVFVSDEVELVELNIHAEV
jgi:hypothetical protein